MGSLLVKNAKLRHGAGIKDIYVEDGKFKEIGENINYAADKVIDAEGNLVTAPIVDPHVHLDAVLVSGLLPKKNETGTLIEAISLWNDWAPGVTKEVIKENARKVIDWYVANGVLRIRTHADCTEPSLKTVEALCELRDEMKDLVDIQVVAFPQNGVFTAPENYDLLRKSLEMGADVVG